MNPLDPVVLFFVLGALAGLAKSDLRVPASFYDVLSIYLLLAIGIKGGIELYKSPLAQLVRPAGGTLLLGVVITAVAYLVARRAVGLSFENAIALAAHYGSVSAVTFAVVISFLKDAHQPYEEFMTVLLVMLEIPAIAVAIGYYKLRSGGGSFDWRRLAHEIFFGKSILLLVGGLLIGVFIAYSGNTQLNFFFLDLFKGFLALFMLEMGIVASERFGDLRRVGISLILFGTLMPLVAATLGILTGRLTGLSVGGCTVLGTMAASASYIAAPAAMKLAVPQANPTLYLTAALGITFPFNILVGISLYYRLAQWMGA